MPFFPLASHFMTFLLGRAQKSKFWVTFIFRHFVFAFPLCPFLISLPRQLTFYWACSPFKNFRESIIETGNFFHGVAMCSGRKFCFEFFTQISENFCAYFRLHWANHSALGIIRKIFSSCRSCLSIEDANFGQRWWRQKWNKGQGSSRVVKGGMEVNRLSLWGGALASLLVCWAPDWVVCIQTLVYSHRASCHPGV